MNPQPPVPPHPTETEALPPNPGQTNGIISLILAFVGLVPFGLVLSIISTVQSKKAHASTILGVIGIVINSIAIITIAFLLIVFSVSYQGMQSRTKDTQASANAALVAQHADTYYAAHHTYPQTINDFNKDSAASLANIPIHVTTSAPTNSSSIMYKPCGLTGAEVVYFSSTTNIPITSYLGDGNPTSCLDKQPINHTL